MFNCDSDALNISPSPFLDIKVRTLNSNLIGINLYASHELPVDSIPCGGFSKSSH